MSNIITVVNLNKLMNYLKLNNYIIPSYNLQMPEEADGSNFRPEKIFRLYRDGTMSYTGYGYGKVVKDIFIANIIPNQRFLTRAYLEMVSEVRKRINLHVKHGGIPNLENLILKFNGIEFINFF